MIDFPTEIDYTFFPWISLDMLLDFCYMNIQHTAFAYENAKAIQHGEGHNASQFIVQCNQIYFEKKCLIVYIPAREHTNTLAAEPSNFYLSFLVFIYASVT